jgi:hypothetical protein
MGTYNSIVIDASADQIWSVLRNFNDMSWADGLIKSVESVNRKDGTEVGAVRMVNGAIRETLTSFDDDAMAFSYSIDDGPDVFAANKLWGYLGTARVSPITATGQAFVEWSSDWESSEGDIKAVCSPLYAGLLGKLATKFN